VADVSELLGVYDAQLRNRVPDPLPTGVTVEPDGPLLRFFGLFGQGNRGFVTYRDLEGLDGSGLDELIARQVRVFAERGEHFEWKQHAHDRPPDLPRRLRAAGFVPEDEETVVIASVDEVAGRPLLPEGVSWRQVTDRNDLDRIAAFEQTAWGDEEDQSWIAEMLEAEHVADPQGLSIVVAEAVARSSAPAGCASSAERASRRYGAAPPCRNGAGAGSTEPRSRIGRAWPPGGVSGSSRSTLRATADRFSSVSASPR